MKSVLILVLVEDCLEGGMPYTKDVDGNWEVLILVLMEDGLKES